MNLSFYNYFIYFGAVNNILFAYQKNNISCLVWLSIFSKFVTA